MFGKILVLFIGLLSFSSAFAINQTITNIGDIVVQSGAYYTWYTYYWYANNWGSPSPYSYSGKYLVASYASSSYAIGTVLDGSYLGGGSIGINRYFSFDSTHVTNSGAQTKSISYIQVYELNNATLNANSLYSTSATLNTPSPLNTPTWFWLTTLGVVQSWKNILFGIYGIGTILSLPIDDMGVGKGAVTTIKPYFLYWTTTITSLGSTFSINVAYFNTSNNLVSLGTLYTYIDSSKTLASIYSLTTTGFNVRGIVPTRTYLYNGVVMSNTEAFAWLVSQYSNTSTVNTSDTTYTGSTTPWGSTSVSEDYYIPTCKVTISNLGCMLEWAWYYFSPRTWLTSFFSIVSPWTITFWTWTLASYTWTCQFPRNLTTYVGYQSYYATQKLSVALTPNTGAIFSFPAVAFDYKFPWTPTPISSGSSQGFCILWEMYYVEPLWFPSHIKSLLLFVLVLGLSIPLFRNYIN